MFELKPGSFASPVFADFAVFGKPTDHDRLIL